MRFLFFSGNLYLYSEKLLPQADLVHDRFHISKYLNNVLQLFSSVIDLKMLVIFHHFMINKKGMIDEYRKNRFCSTSTG